MTRAQEMRLTPQHSLVHCPWQGLLSPMPWPLQVHCPACPEGQYQPDTASLSPCNTAPAGCSLALIPYCGVQPGPDPLLRVAAWP